MMEREPWAMVRQYPRAVLRLVPSLPPEPPTPSGERVLVEAEGFRLTSERLEVGRALLAAGGAEGLRHAARVAGPQAAAGGGAGGGAGGALAAASAGLLPGDGRAGGGHGARLRLHRPAGGGGGHLVAHGAHRRGRATGAVLPGPPALRAGGGGARRGAGAPRAQASREGAPARAGTLSSRSPLGEGWGEGLRSPSCSASSAPSDAAACCAAPSSRVARLPGAARPLLPRAAPGTARGFLEQRSSLSGRRSSSAPVASPSPTRCAWWWPPPRCACGAPGPLLLRPAARDHRLPGRLPDSGPHRRGARRGEELGHRHPLVAVGAGGPENPHDGHSTATHEFAHVLDREDGAFDGTPQLRQYSHYRAWASVMGEHFHKLRQGQRPERQVMDDYGGLNEAEFFAVATESFFEKPRQMREKTPELYAELQRSTGGIRRPKRRSPNGLTGARAAARRGAMRVRQRTAHAARGVRRNGGGCRCVPRFRACAEERPVPYPPHEPTRVSLTGGALLGWEVWDALHRLPVGGLHLSGPDGPGQGRRVARAGRPARGEDTGAPAAARGAARGARAHLQYRHWRGGGHPHCRSSGCGR